MAGKAVIIMGSERDLDFSREITKYLKLLGVTYEFRVASAHKTPEKVLEIIKEFENQKVVFVTVAGRSNALSAFIDGNTTKPVIACPPYSEKFGGADIYSSLRVPSGIGSVVTIEPEGAAIGTAKITQRIWLCRTCACLAGGEVVIDPRPGAIVVCQKYGCCGGASRGGVLCTLGPSQRREKGQACQRGHGHEYEYCLEHPV